MSHHINITRIKSVANALSEYKDEFAFVGGATVSLYADEPEYTETRPTEDIDVLVEIASYGAYTKLQETLAALGFAIDTEAKITCRYKYQGLTVDVMPIEEEVLGFKNRWYKEGFANLEIYQIAEGTDIRIFPVAYFLASKIEAFHDRGNDDGRMSKDFEDIVFVLDNRKNVWNEIMNARGTVAEYLKSEFANLLGLPHVNEWISGHLDPITAGARSRRIIDGLKLVAG